MPEIATIGLDIAKNVFQLHGVDRSGKIVLRKALRRSQCRVSSAHCRLA
jgi:transposase